MYDCKSKGVETAITSRRVSILEEFVQNVPGESSHDDDKVGNNFLPPQNVRVKRLHLINCYSH